MTKRRITLATPYHSPATFPVPNISVQFRRHHPPTGAPNTLCSKKVTPKYKSQQLRQILSELNILLAALIIAFLAQMLQISTKSIVQIMSNSRLKMELKNISFQSGKYQLAYLLHEVLRVCLLYTSDAADE